MSEEFYQIGQISELADISKRTVRYYQEVGLIEPSKLTEGGFRLFNKKDLHRLKIIKVFKDLGFELKEIQDMLPNKTLNTKKEMIDYSKNVIKKQIEVINQQIDNLEKTKEKRLVDLILLNTCEKCTKEVCPPECKSKEAYI